MHAVHSRASALSAPRPYTARQCDALPPPETRRPLVRAQVPLEKLSRKELQGKAIEAGLKANAKSADLIRQLNELKKLAAGGLDALVPHKRLANPAIVPKGEHAESIELEELQALGIKGKVTCARSSPRTARALRRDACRSTVDERATRPVPSSAHT